MKQILIQILIAAIASYAFVAFFNLDVNPESWGYGGRFAFILMLSLLSLVIIVEHNLNDKS